MPLFIPPKLAVSSYMGYLKGKSALMMFGKHANIKYQFGNWNFWSEGAYVPSVESDWANMPSQHLTRNAC